LWPVLMEATLRVLGDSWVCMLVWFSWVCCVGSVACVAGGAQDDDDDDDEVLIVVCVAGDCMRHDEWCDEVLPCKARIKWFRSKLVRMSTMQRDEIVSNWTAKHTPEQGTTEERPCVRGHFGYVCRCDSRTHERYMQRLTCGTNRRNSPTKQTIQKYIRPR
jgi:hypothetical protein